MKAAISASFRKKPMAVATLDLHSGHDLAQDHDHDHVQDQEHRRLLESPPQSPGAAHGLRRHLGLLDLLCIGIGGTVGTGIFALCGYIAAEFAGPSVVLCWAIAGFCSMLNGVAYMELSTRIPCAGSTYAYAYTALGELPAVVAGWYLTLEYGISGAAVARSWADKVFKWVAGMDLAFAEKFGKIADQTYANGLAAGIQLICVLVLVAGVSLGKQSVNFVTVVKVLLIVFMTITGFLLFNPENIANGFPPPQHSQSKPFGWSGVFLGSTTAFFGFIGFDEVSCMAAEAKEPGKIMHLAVSGTIIGTTILSSLAALALVGMQPYLQIDSDSAFGYAFKYNGLGWAAQIVEIGEILTLPVVVLISFLAQPRLLYAMSQDGLLPKVFSKTDKNGNITWGIIISGIFCTLIAFSVPFAHLNDLCSAGVLMSFTMSNISLVMVRLELANVPKPKRKLSKMLMAVYTIFTGLAAFFIVKGNLAHLSVQLISGMSLAVSLGCFIWLFLIFPNVPKDSSSVSYHAPFVPFIQLGSVLLNWMLIAQLSWMGIGLVCGYTLLAVLSYLLYGYHYSVGNTDDWHNILMSKGMACKCKICKSSVINTAFNETWWTSRIGEALRIPFRSSPYISSRRRRVQGKNSQSGTGLSEKIQEIHPPLIPHSFPSQDVSWIVEAIEEENVSPKSPVSPRLVSIRQEIDSDSVERINRKSI